MPAANWVLAAAWVWLALAVFAACVWDRARHRLPPLRRARVGGLAGSALLVACVLAAWGWQQPGNGAEPDAVAASVWHCLAVVVAAVHLATASCLLGGSIYLAFGRLMGSRACAACGWQSMIVERLPEVAVAAAITALGLAVFGGSTGAADRAWGRVLWPILQAGVVWWLLLLNRSVLMVRQPAVLRTASLWLVLAVVGRIGWRFCLDSVAGDIVAAGWLAGVACGVALAVLAAGLHRLALVLGLRFDRPAALAEIVGGLSPLRRLAACALGGLCLAAVGGLPLAWRDRESLVGAEARLLVVALAFLWLLVTWGAGFLRDRLGPACSPSISAATILGLLGLASLWGWLAGNDFSTVPAVGLSIFLGSLGIASLGIAWCAAVSGRHGGVGGCARERPISRGPGSVDPARASPGGPSADCRAGGPRRDREVSG